MGGFSDPTRGLNANIDLLWLTDFELKQEQNSAADILFRDCFSKAELMEDVRT